MGAKMLGRYRVESLLHKGGMGEIILARTTGPGGFTRRVVVKRLKRDLHEDPTIRTLFEREAFLMARLHHPNIVRALDYFFAGGAPHLVLEHIQGRNLRNVAFMARHKFGRFPVRYALYAVAQMLRGLHYTHHVKDEHDKQLSIAHRDICPSNVMVSYFGEVKVTDFGIANMAGAERLTSPGYFRGKVQYAAPEQMTGEGGGIQSDIYSAGVVLAELLTGKMVFAGKSAGDTVTRVLSEDRENTINRIFEDVRPLPGFRSALRGALAVLPQDRFTSALQFAETLEAIARSNDVECSPPQLGLFMRRVYEAEPDLPVEDGFDIRDGAIPSFQELAQPEDEEEAEEVRAFALATRKKSRLFRWLPFVRAAVIGG